MSIQMLDITKIRIDGDTQPRVAIDENAVKQYAADIEHGAEFPPVQVMFDGATYWLVDGFHRYHAHKSLVKTQIAAEVTPGVQTEAQWESLTANKTHGLRRTNDDKIKAVRKALTMHPEFTDPVLAKHVGVAQPTILKYRLRMKDERQARFSASKPSLPPSQEPEAPRYKDYTLPHRTGRDGKKYPTHQKRNKKPVISSQAMTPIRGHNPVEQRTHVGMSKDPLMGARALIEFFDRPYLETLVSELRALLDGTAGPPPSLRDIPQALVP